MIKNTSNNQNNNSLAIHGTVNNMDIESNNSSDLEDEDEDDEDMIVFEKQGQKESILSNIEDSSNTNNSTIGHNKQGVSDKWIKDTHKFIENLFAVNSN